MSKTCFGYTKTNQSSCLHFKANCPMTMRARFQSRKMTWLSGWNGLRSLVTWTTPCWCLWAITVRGIIRKLTGFFGYFTRWYFLNTNYSCPSIGSLPCVTHNRANSKNVCHFSRSCYLNGLTGNIRQWLPTWITTLTVWRPRSTYTQHLWVSCTEKSLKPTMWTSVLYRCSTRY